jgi:deoxyribodipyrimidine photo-lyase
MTTAIFIFTRDLRSTDNTGLDYCMQNFDLVIPVFFLTDTQTNKKNNKYFSEKSFSFMKSALGKLQKDIKLNIFKTRDFGQKCLLGLLEKYQVTSLVISKDYTPFAKKRESVYTDMCNKKGIKFMYFHDHLLLDNFIVTPKGTPYRKFTPFYSKALQIKPRKASIIDHFGSKKLMKIQKDLTLSKFIDFDFDKAELYIKDYLENRKTISKDSTKISRYLKFGIYSIRQVYYKYKNNSEFVRSLLWKDFYYSYYHDDHLALSQGDLNVGRVKWNKSKTDFEKWCKGQTGFPIVDAGMRELDITGFMQNRGRLVTASFLTKNLMIDWKEGERYFASKLYDYDWIINAGNWQNVSSVAKHSSPYFRIMNPWIQSKKFDTDCEYIKKWIPELSNVPCKDIHTWNESYSKYPGVNYSKPIIDFQKSKEKYLDYFKK